MTSTSNEALMELLAAFIRLRQTGTDRDEAWYTTLEHATTLSEKQVQQLLMMAKNWEQREGHQYHYHTDKHATTTVNNESVIRPLQPRPATPHNPDTARLDPLPESEAADRAAYFEDGMKLAIQFEGFPNAITLSIPTTKEVIIGRNTPHAAMSPDIDLAQFDNGHYGISRLHVALRRQGNTIIISDLGSSNHTFLNGEQLYPHEVRVLKDGDAVGFARLIGHIHFIH